MGRLKIVAFVVAVFGIVSRSGVLASDAACGFGAGLGVRGEVYALYSLCTAVSIFYLSVVCRE